MNKSILSVLAVVSVISAIIFGCSLPGSTDSPDLNNPDPYPYDSSDPLVNIGYSIYANVDNQIYKFDSNDPENHPLVVGDIDPANPRFYVTDVGGVDYIVFVRDENAEGASGHYLVVKNTDSGNEEYLSLDASSSTLIGEFVVHDGHVIYSDSGLLTDYDISSGGIEYINADRSDFACNHFINIGADDLLTFTEHDPYKLNGLIHALPYNGTPQHVLGPSMNYANFSFGTLFYPVTYDADAMICLASPTHTDTLYNYFDFESSPTYTEVTCEDTDDVDFCKIYQTPAGSKTFLYGYRSVYWFDSSSRPMSDNDFEVSGREFSDTIQWITATPDDTYIILNDNDGIWVYDSNFDQIHCHFSWLSGINEVLWLEVK